LFSDGVSVVFDSVCAGIPSWVSLTSGLPDNSGETVGLTLPDSCGSIVALTLGLGETKGALVGDMLGLGLGETEGFAFAVHPTKKTAVITRTITNKIAFLKVRSLSFF